MPNIISLVDEEVRKLFTFFRRCFHFWAKQTANNRIYYPEQTSVMLLVEVTKLEK